MRHLLPDNPLRMPRRYAGISARTTAFDLGFMVAVPGFLQRRTVVLRSQPQNAVTGPSDRAPPTVPGTTTASPESSSACPDSSGGTSAGGSVVQLHQVALGAAAVESGVAEVVPEPVRPGIHPGLLAAAAEALTVQRSRISDSGH
jgi:hypothetical protein